MSSKQLMLVTVSPDLTRAEAGNRVSNSAACMILATVQSRLGPHWGSVGRGCQLRLPLLRWLTLHAETACSNRSEERRSEAPARRAVVVLPGIQSSGDPRWSARRRCQHPNQGRPGSVPDKGAAGCRALGLAAGQRLAGVPVSGCFCHDCAGCVLLRLAIGNLTAGPGQDVGILLWRP